MTSGPSNENPRQEREHLLPTQQPGQLRGRKRAPLVEVTNLAVMGGRARATAKRAALRPHLAVRVSSLHSCGSQVVPLKERFP
ncbi:unnamed protein product, partial [Closterium sp. Naga37s-1]